MPRTPALALSVAASLLFSGCAVGPNYVTPPKAVADSFHGSAALKRQKAVDAEELASWWTGFHDPLLTQLISEALSQNLDLAQATARSAQARAGVAAAGAAMAPIGAVSGQAAKSYQSVETPLGRVLNSTPNFDRSGSSYEVNASASWELDIAGGLRRERESALAEYQASEAGIAAVRLTVAAATADVYVQIRGLQARLAIAQDQVKTEEGILAKVRLLNLKGLAADSTVRQAEASASEARAAVPALEAALEGALNALDVLLGTPIGSHRAELSEPAGLPTPPSLNAVGTPADLLRRRPDLIVAERRLASATARIGVAVAEYYPKLSLNALLGSATTLTGGNLFSNGANQSAASLGLRWRLFDFGRINAQIDQAKGQEAEALAAFKLAALRATEDVETSVYTMERRTEQASAIAAATASLRNARASTEAALQRGTLSQIELLQADKAVLRAADAEVLARTESARAAILAFKSLGGGWTVQDPRLAVAD
ncbi:MAG: efflux transporter outer membrane subunit [Pelomonas sp.]|nr:efflux transporter outer membrane subunit [Roseateles sp.]